MPTHIAVPPSRRSDESDAHGELGTAFERDRHRPQPVPRIVHELEVVAVLVGVHRGVIARLFGAGSSQYAHEALYT